jgi:hypothetical protein
MRFARLRTLGLRAVYAAILLGGGVALLGPRALPAAQAAGCPLPAPALQTGATAMPFNLDDLLAQMQQAAAASGAGSHLCLASSTADGSLQVQLTLDSSGTALRLHLTVSSADGTGLANMLPEGSVVVTSGGQTQVLGLPLTDETGQSQLEVAYDPTAGPVQVAVHLQLAGARLDTTTVLGG